MIYYKGRQIDEINAYNVEGTTLNNQSKEIEINKNGETIITYDEGYTGLEQVTVNVNVASQGGGNSILPLGTKLAYSTWTTLPSEISNADVSNITDMSRFFYSSTTVTSMDLSSWNVSKVTKMDSMFQYCKKLKTLDLSGWNLASLTSADSMFRQTLLTNLNITGWNTPKLTDMSYMFNLITATTATLDLSSINTSLVTDMSGMFLNSDGISVIDMSGWNTSKVTSYANMFSGCEVTKIIMKGCSSSTISFIQSRLSDASLSNVTITTS